jgi:hypothetical protein
MNVTYSSIHRTLSAKRLLATALVLGASLVATPLLAADNTQAHAAPQASTPTRNSEALEVSSSRINGRIDWDVDYPSQLAPQPVDTARHVGHVAESASAAAATQVTVR